MKRVVCVSGWATGPWIFSKVISSGDEPKEIASAGSVDMESSQSIAMDYVDWFGCLGENKTAINAVLDAAAEPVVLVGWSLGSILVLEAATVQTSKIAAMVLVSPFLRFVSESSGDAVDWHGVDPRQLAAMRRRIGRSPERVLSDFATACALPMDDPLFHQRFMAEAELIPAVSLSTGLDYLATVDVRDVIAGLPHVPVRVLYGDADRIVPPESSEATAKRIGEVVGSDNFEVRRIEGAGHALPWYHADAISEAIREVAV